MAQFACSAMYSCDDDLWSYSFIIIITGLLMQSISTTDEKVLKISTGWVCFVNDTMQKTVCKSMYYQSESKSYLCTQSVKLLREKWCSSKPKAVRGLYGGPAQALKPGSTEMATVMDHPVRAGTSLQKSKLQMQNHHSLSRAGLDWCDTASAMQPQSRWVRRGVGNDYVVSHTPLSTQKHFRWSQIK